MCSTRLAGNIGRKNDAKKIAICAPSHKFVGLYLRKMYGQSEKKLVKQQHLHMSSQYRVGYFGPLAAEIGSGDWSTPAISTNSRLGFVTAATSLTGGQQGCLAVSWAGTLCIYTVNQKKRGSLFLTITLANLNRFL